jgi:protein-S-isoprenylcysteine O-methyltransferase Ste14
VEKHALKAILVLLQFVIAAAIVLTARVDWNDFPFLVLATAGAIVAIWSWVTMGAKRLSMMPSVNERTELVTDGPYRFVRHPMYASLLVFCGGLVFTPLALWKVIAWCVLVGVLIAKARLEEAAMRDHFESYGEYAQRTAAFFPGIW